MQERERGTLYPWVETRLVAKFNVTTTTSSTSLFNNPILLSKIEIDGVEYTGNDIYSHYNHTFSTTGIHTVKYTLNDGVTSIDSGSFAGKSNMMNITIPDTITTIGGSAFASCTSLTSIEIPSSVTSIGYAAFAACSNLTNINIPSSVTTIGSGAFSGSNFSFEDIIFEAINPNATFSVDTTNKIITNATGDTLLCGFYNTVAIPSTVTSIGNSAFYGCTGLTSITIPSGVTSIDQYAFYCCTSLTNITSLRTTAPTVTYNTFQGVKTGGTLYVPSGSTGYNTWMGTGNYYLGKYNWTKVEQ